MDEKKPNGRWIIALCVSITMTVVSLTVTTQLALQLRAMDEDRSDAAKTTSLVMAHNVRLAVLENKYDTIQASLAEIKALIQAHMAAK
jgi:hypothetical protein